MVVLFHAAGAVADEIAFAPFSRFGAAGVDVFFVISGFVMAGKDGESAGSFLASRLRRIAPLYWLMTAFVALAALAVIGQASRPEEIITSLAFWPWAGENGMMPVLYVGWTLNYEMAFYGLFAACLLLPRYRVASAVIVLAGAALIGTAPIATAQANFFTDPVVLEFAFGLMLGKAQGRLRRVPSVIGTVAMLVGGALLVALPPPDAWRFLAWGGPAALIVAGAVVMEAGGVKLIGARLGNASYAVYLVHTTAIAGVAMLGLSGDLFVIAAALAAAGLGLALHRWVERPLSRLLPRPAGSSAIARIA